MASNSVFKRANLTVGLSSQAPARVDVPPDRLAVIEAKLDQILAALQPAGRGQRTDPADEALILAIAGVIGDGTFTARAVLKHCDLGNDPALRAALDGADIDGAHALGWTLRRLTGSVIAAWRVHRLDGDHRDGVQWQLVRVSASFLESHHTAADSEL